MSYNRSWTRYFAAAAALTGAGVAGATAISSAIKRSDHRRSKEGDPVNFEIPGMKQHDIPAADGTMLHLTECGEGPRVLFLIHGVTCHESIYRFQQREFSKHYRVISLELPGHGRSGRPSNRDYSIHRFAGDIRSAIEYFNPEEFVLAGFSMGGFSSMKFHERFGEEYGDRLKGIVLVDSHGVLLLDGLFRNNIFGLIFKLFDPFPLRPLLRYGSYLSPVVDPVMDLLKGWSLLYLVMRWAAFGKHPVATSITAQVAMSMSTSFSTIALCVESMLKHDVRSHLGQIRTPVLILVGDRDKLVHPDSACMTAERLPDVRVVVVPGVGHCGLIDWTWPEYNEEIRAFLNNRMPAQT